MGSDEQNFGIFGTNGTPKSLMEAIENAQNYQKESTYYHVRDYFCQCFTVAYGKLESGEQTLEILQYLWSKVENLDKLNLQKKTKNE